MDNDKIELVIKLVDERKQLMNDKSEFDEMQYQLAKFVQHNTDVRLKETNETFVSPRVNLSRVTFENKCGDNLYIQLSPQAYFDLMDYACQRLSKRINDINKQLQEL